jgi:hypothetical protein
METCALGRAHVSHSRRRNGQTPTEADRLRPDRRIVCAVRRSREHVDQLSPIRPSHVAPAFSSKLEHARFASLDHLAGRSLQIWPKRPALTQFGREPVSPVERPPVAEGPAHDSPPLPRLVQSAGGDIAAIGDLVFHELSQAKNKAAVTAAKTSSRRAPEMLRASGRALMDGWIGARPLPPSLVPNIATSKIPWVETGRA